MIIATRTTQMILYLFADICAGKMAIIFKSYQENPSEWHIHFFGLSMLPPIDSA
jgi:hypothetical protein